MHVIPIPNEAASDGSMDDLAAAVAAKHPKNVEVHATETMRAIKDWLEKDGLSLANNKAEAVLRTNIRKKENREGCLWAGYQVASVIIYDKGKPWVFISKGS